MKTEMFTVLDQVADHYLEPFFSPTIESGIRAFKSVVQTEGHQFGKFPEDYALYHIGTYDGGQGTIEAKMPNKVAMATSFIQAGQIAQTRPEAVANA